MGKKSKKGKFKSGTYIEREMYMSRAFLSLTGFAPQLLILFLGKRDFTNDHVCINCQNITMTYAELENIFNHGKPKHGMPKDGITRPKIIRAITQLLANGFLEIRHQGGAYKQDKSIYALSDKWRLWRPDMVFSERPKDTRTRGYRKSKINITHENVTHTHA